MAVLGNGGRLELRREAGSACVVLPEDLSHTYDTFEIGCEGYWPGDKVNIGSPEGLPIFINGDPQRWDGVASYFGSSYYLAENRDHITARTDNFYKDASEEYPAGEAGDNAWFYYRGTGDAGETPVTNIEGYLCVDSLGRVKLYPDRCAGLNCCGTPLLDFGAPGAGLQFDFLLVNHAGSAEYQNALSTCFGEIGEYLFNDIAENDGVPDPNRAIDSMCARPPLYEQPVAGVDEFDNADFQPRGSFNKGAHPLWTVLCDMREWSLELDAPSVDTTGVGEKFGEAVKSVVTGGGSLDFFIDRSCYDEGKDGGLYIMQLLTMTQMEGCKARARFYMINEPYNSDNCAPNCSGSLPGSLWYETDILITRNAVNLRPTELVAGTANFVTTGEIKLQQGEVLNP